MHPLEIENLHRNEGTYETIQPLLETPPRYLDPSDCKFYKFSNVYGCVCGFEGYQFIGTSRIPSKSFIVPDVGTFIVPDGLLNEPNSFRVPSRSINGSLKSLTFNIALIGKM